VKSTGVTTAIAIMATGITATTPTATLHHPHLLPLANDRTTR